MHYNKRDKGIDYVHSWNTNEVTNSKIKPSYTSFLTSIKLSGYKMGIKFDKDPLAVKQNNYMCEIVNVYIVYDLDAWPRNPLNNFKFKNCLCRATIVIKNSHKEKYLYSGYGITFDSAGSWSFDNDVARNVMIFVVNNSSSSHADRRKNNFLVLGESLIFRIKAKFVSPGKRFITNFSKANTKVCLSLHHNADNTYLFVNGKEVSKFKAYRKHI